jgi:hypothetical protein
MIAEWLIILRKSIKSENMTRREWFVFKKKITKFRIINGYLFRNNIKNVSFRKIINLVE